MEFDEGLLFILGKAPAGRVDSFNEWYDEHHAPARLGVPGIRTARRYSDIGLDNGKLTASDVGLTALEQAMDDPADGSEFDAGTYLTYYDLRDLTVLDSAGYRDLAAAATDDELALSKLARFDRRVYTSTVLPDLANARDSSICGRFLVCSWWSPAEGDDEDDNHWMDTEYLPRVMSIPGWRRARRFKLVDGAGPKYLGMYDLDHLEAFTGGEYQAAADRAAQSDVVGGRVAAATRLLRLHRRFDTAESR